MARSDFRERRLLLVADVLRKGAARMEATGRRGINRDSGRSPVRIIRWRRCSTRGSGTGTAESSARV